MGAWSGASSSTVKKKNEPYPIGDELVGFESLTSNQQVLSDAMVKVLQGAMSSYGQGGGAGGFKAEYAEPFSPYGGQVGGALEQALLTALSGKVPTEAFQTGVANPTRRTFEQTTAPAIREEFAGPGTFWGTARANKVTGERANMETGLVEQSARMVEGALQRALQATPVALNAQQTAIQTALQEYVRNNPGASEALQAALQYLGIPMLATYQPYEDTKKSGGVWGGGIS